MVQSKEPYITMPKSFWAPWNRARSCLRFWFTSMRRLPASNCITRPEVITGEMPSSISEPTHGKENQDNVRRRHKVRCMRRQKSSDGSSWTNEHKNKDQRALDHREATDRDLHQSTHLQKLRLQTSLIKLLEYFIDSAGGSGSSYEK